LPYKFICFGNYKIINRNRKFILYFQQSLNDMKWKCFRRELNYRLENNQSGRIDNYKDPVLIAYWKALHADILCAWKRVPTDDGQKTERELWLFGINEDLPSDLLHLRR